MKIEKIAKNNRSMYSEKNREMRRNKRFHYTPIDQKKYRMEFKKKEKYNSNFFLVIILIVLFLLVYFIINYQI